MKSYTDIKQSRKLAEILPLESADACWTNHLFDSFLSSWRVESTPLQEYKCLLYRFVVKGYLIEPAWSLVSLLGVLPKIGAEEPMVRKLYYANEPKERYICEYGLTNITSEYDNPIDACYEMILKLNELKLL